MHVEISNHTDNYEVITFLIEYGHFRAQMTLLNVDAKSPRKNLKESFAGNFGGVSKFLCENGELVALKGVMIREGQFELALMGCLKECLLVHIAAALEVGPLKSSLFGFDLVAFRDEIVFCMEFCEGIRTISQQDQIQMKNKLQTLHRLRIVHLDIKPENLGFSSQNFSPVFIDFGFSKILKEFLGSKSFSPFMGSINYCSKEMVDLYVREMEGYVDLYYNDATCLWKSIIQLRANGEDASSGLDLMVHHPKLSEFRRTLSIVRAKHIFYHLCCDNMLITHALLSQARNTAIKQPIIYEFIQGLSQSSRSISYFRKYLYRNQGEITALIGISLRKGKILSKNDLFEARLDAISRINSFSPWFESSRDTHLGIINDPNSPEPISHLAAIRFIKIGASAGTFQQKVQVCRRLISYEGTPTALLKETVKNIFEDSLSTLNREAQFQALINSIQTIVALEILSEEDFQAAFEKCFHSDLGLLKKIRVLFEFIASLQIVNQKYIRKYRYDYLKYTFLTKFSLLVKNFIPSNEGQQYINLLLNYILNQNFGIDTPYFLFNERGVQQKLYFDRYNENFQFFKSLKVYFYSLNITKSIQRSLNYSSIDFQTLLLLVNKQSSFYPHLIISKIYYLTRKHELLSSIYSSFLQQLQPFQQHKSFKIFFINKLSYLKKQFVYRHQTFTKFSNGQFLQNNQTNIQLKSIFEILSYVIQNSNDCYHYAQLIFSLNPEIIHQVVKPYLKQFFESYQYLLLQNKQKTTDESTNCRHEHSQGRKISILSNIIQYCYPSNLIEQRKIYSQKILAFTKEIIDSINCSECYLISLVEINIVIANFIDDYEDAFSARLQLALYLFKIKEYEMMAFNLLIVIIRTIYRNKQLSDRYRLQPLLYNYCMYTKRYTLLFSDVRQLNPFMNVYVYITMYKTQDELLQFIYNTARAIMIMKSSQSVLKFYLSVMELIRINQKCNTLMDLKEYHNIIIYKILNYEKMKNNLFLAIYLYCFLSINMANMFQQPILRRISIQLDSLDRYSRSIIFDNYYAYFCLYFQLKGRKKYYITLKQTKYRIAKRPLRRLLKEKLKQNIGNCRSKLPYRNFSKYITNYHANIDNIL